MPRKKKSRYFGVSKQDKLFCAAMFAVVSGLESDAEIHVDFWGRAATPNNDAAKILLGRLKSVFGERSEIDLAEKLIDLGYGRIPYSLSGHSSQQVLVIPAPEEKRVSRAARILEPKKILQGLSFEDRSPS